MTSSSKYIFIHTAVYGYDGHQWSLNLTINKKTMKFIRERYEKVNGRPANLTGEFVSQYSTAGHSWNQFVIMDGDTPVFLDHGDSRPRSIKIARWGKGTTDADYVYMLEYPTNNFGPYQETGASVGGFELSDTTFIVVGNTEHQDENYGRNTTRNIFVSTISKELNGKIEIEPYESGKLDDLLSGKTKPKKNPRTATATVTMITNYEEGDGTCSTPQLVKISKNRFILMWARTKNKDATGKEYFSSYDTIYYTLLDGKGKQISKIYSKKGYLSDCQPVKVSGNKVVWYVRYDGKMEFYTLDTKKMSVSVTVGKGK